MYDSDTKLTRFGYRDYDAYTGKWTAKDPIGFAGGDSNLYGYVLGDPVGYWDSIGLFTNNSNKPVEIKPEKGPMKTLFPNESYDKPMDGFRVPAWGDKWLKTSGGSGEYCNINSNGTPDIPWYVPEFEDMPHRWPGIKPKDYDWFKELDWMRDYLGWPWF